MDLLGQSLRLSRTNFDVPRQDVLKQPLWILRLVYCHRLFQARPVGLAVPFPRPEVGRATHLRLEQTRLLGYHLR